MLEGIPLALLLPEDEGWIVGTLRLLDAARPARHEGEGFACDFTTDGAYVLSAGWDGHLRLWEAASGEAIADQAVSAKPLSACAFSPDGRQWLAGSMEGMM